MLTSEGVARSAIEGERFDPNAIRSSLSRRLGVPTAGPPAPPRSVEGLVDVLLDATEETRQTADTKARSPAGGHFEHEGPVAAFVTNSPTEVRSRAGEWGIEMQRGQCAQSATRGESNTELSRRLLL